MVESKDPCSAVDNNSREHTWAHRSQQHLVRKSELDEGCAKALASLLQAFHDVGDVPWRAHLRLCPAKCSLLSMVVHSAALGVVDWRVH